MKRFYSCAILVFSLLAAVLAGGCTAAPAEQSNETSASAQTESSCSQTAEEGAAPSGEASSCEETAAGQSGWTVVYNDKIAHPTNIAGFLNEDFGITVGYSGEIHYTNDAGKTWPQAENSSACRFCLDIVDENIAWAGGNADMVRVTRDGGKTWTAVTDIDLSGGHSNIDFVDDTTGWVASLSKLAVTKDGGNTWTEMPKPEGSNGIAAIYLKTPENGYLLSHEGILYTTTDGGATWSGQDVGFESYGLIDLKGQPMLGQNNLAVADISFTDENNGTIVFVGMSSEGGIKTWCINTADGGASWALESLPDLGFTPAKVFITGDGKYLTLANTANQTAVLKRQD